MLWPAGLAVFYAMSYGGLGLRAVIVGVMLIAITIVVCRAGKERKYLPVGWLWYLVTLVPVIGIVQVGTQSHADRYTYVPLVGIFVALAWAMGDVIAERPRLRRAFFAAAVVILAVLGTMTHQMVKYWRDDVTLFGRAVAVGQKNYVTLGNLGVALGNRGEVDRGLAYLGETQALYPDDVRILVAMGSLNENRGRLTEAKEYYEKALSLDPKIKDAQVGMASVLVHSGRAQEALPYCRRAIELDANLALAYNIMGMALSDTGKLDESLAAFRKVLELRPDMVVVYRNMAIVYGKQGDLSGILWAYERLNAAKPEYSTWLSLGKAQFDMERLAEAERSCREAIRLDPKQAAAYVGLAAILEKRGYKTQAVAVVEKALAMEPNSIEARQTYERLTK
jgi:protein O-mannosyl-transferase